MGSCDLVKMKSFKFVDPGGAAAAQSTSTQPATETDWKLCFICQGTKTESLTSPSQSKRKDKGSSYSSLAENLNKFNELGLLPRTFLLERLDEGSGVEAALITNNAQYHQSCKLRYNNTKLERAEKRLLKMDVEEEEEVTACK